ncbi:MAG: trypsin-like serine protease [Bdellovibrionota bacterium]
MRSLVVIFFIAALAYQAQAIVGGEVANESSIESYSSVAVSSWFGRCSGTIIDKNLILSSASCLAEYFPDKGYVAEPDKAYVQLKNKPPMSVEKIVLHPGYDRHLYPDLAIIKLTENIPAPFMPVDLVEDTSVLTPGLDIILAGFGATKLKYQESKDRNTLYTKTVKTDRVFEKFGMFSYWEEGACEGDHGGSGYIQKNGRLMLIGVMHYETEGLSAICTKYGALESIPHNFAWISKTAKELNTVGEK